MRQSAEDVTAATIQYEDHKKDYLGTNGQCEAAGFDFAPFVLEAHGGGLGAIARRHLAFIASAVATVEGDTVEVKAARVAGGLSIAVMRETARSVVRRLASPADCKRFACPDGWCEPDVGASREEV